MAKSPRLSIIVPVKNEEKLLPQCLDALKRQRTSRLYEILVIDSNSTDNTKKIARAYGVRYINEPKRGKIYGFIRGGREARGEILCFTEADCVVPRHWVETIASYLDTHHEVVAVSGWYTFHAPGALPDTFVRFALGISHALSLLLYRHATFRCSNSAVRRSAYRKVGGFRRQYHELYDTDLGKRLRVAGAIHHVPAMEIKNSDRRIRGRLLQYIGELIPTLFHVVLLERPLTRQSYQDIR